MRCRCNLSMDLYDMLKKTPFNRHAYSINRPLGIWQAKIDRAVYSKTSETSHGRRGIHLYVEHRRSGQKICLFIPVLRGFDPATIADNFSQGDIIEVEIAISKSGLPAVKTLRKLDRSAQLHYKKKSTSFRAL
jgi:hypothetical protein